MNDKKEKTSEKIKHFRKIKNISQEQLAELSGINVSTIKKYECGFRNPKPDQLLKIASALGISINAFVSFDITSISDVLSLLVKLDEQTDMDFDYKKDTDGKIIPETISLSFSDQKINEALKLYLQLKKAHQKEDMADENSAHPHNEYSYLVDELLMNIEK